MLLSFVYSNPEQTNQTQLWIGPLIFYEFHSPCSFSLWLEGEQRLLDALNPTHWTFIDLLQ